MNWSNHDAMIQMSLNAMLYVHFHSLKYCTEAGPEWGLIRGQPHGAPPCKGH